MTPNKPLPTKFKINALVGDKGLAEIYQSMSLRMALLRTTDDPNTLDKITPFVVCRDFLVDSYSFQKAGKDFGIYGFSFKGSTDKLDWDAVRLLLKFPDAAARSNFEHNLKYIRDIERANKIPESLLIQTDNPEWVVLQGDVRWLQNCLMFSFYSFMPRIACYPVPADVKNARDWLKALAEQKTSDGKYVESIKPATWDKILADLTILETDDFCGFDVNTVSTGTVHHNSGMISVLGWHTEISPATVKTNPHWKLMEERGLETCVGSKEKAA